MKAKCLEYTTWYTLTFEAGEVYDIDEPLYARLIRSKKFVPAKETVEGTPAKVKIEKTVEQPEKPVKANFKPVATGFKPLPETDDLAIKPVPVKPKTIPVKHKQLKKINKMGDKEQNPKPSHAPDAPKPIPPAGPKPVIEPKPPVGPPSTDVPRTGY